MILYICKQNKIDYIRDHCKDNTFEVIKAKTNLSYANTSLFVFEMIQDLENIFDEFDKVAKLDAFLYDLKFGMAITNLKETFNEYFARFILAIMPLDFIDQYKVSNIPQILSKKLRFKMAVSTTYNLFS